MEVFGPVPSRRLGRSLGINLIPPKICSYGCRYCQLGNTLNMTIERGDFYDVREAFSMIESKMEEIKSSGTKVDYMAFVPDWEPVLKRCLETEEILCRTWQGKTFYVRNLRQDKKYKTTDTIIVHCLAF